MSQTNKPDTSVSESRHPSKHKSKSSRASVGDRFSSAVVASDLNKAPSKDLAIPPDLVELGRVSDAFGVHGWIKVIPHAQNSRTLRSNKQWWLGHKAQPNAPMTYFKTTVLQIKTHGQALVAQLAGVVDRTQAEAWRNVSVLIPRSAFDAAQQDEFYWVDLEHCFVQNEDASVFGWVESVIDNGAHAILVVNLLATRGRTDDPVFEVDAKGRVKQLLIPFVEAHVPQVDIATKTIVTSWPLDF